MQNKLTKRMIVAGRNELREKGQKNLGINRWRFKFRIEAFKRQQTTHHLSKESKNKIIEQSQNVIRLANIKALNCFHFILFFDVRYLAQYYFVLHTCVPAFRYAPVRSFYSKLKFTKTVCKNS